MGEVNRAYRIFDFNTEKDLKPNTTSRFATSTMRTRNYENYEDFKSEFLDVGKSSTRFRQYLYLKSNHHKFWHYVHEATEACITKGGASDVSQSLN